MSDARCLKPYGLVLVNRLVQRDIVYFSNVPVITTSLFILWLQLEREKPAVYFRVRYTHRSL